jgi:anaerobic selenocysteine-containing dehydrogenase
VLALSLAHVLARDGLVDKRLVRDRIVGFGAWRDQAGVEQPGFEGLLRSSYAPEQTQEVTGIAPATVERLAHALAERPAMVASDGDATAASNGLATGMAIAALNALLGSFEQGEAFAPNWKAPTVDALAAAGSAAPRIDGAGTAACPLGVCRVQAVPAAITQANPYPVEALFLHGADPLAALPGRQAWVAALKQVPLVVSFTSWLDQSAWQADLVLPESLFLEALDLVRAAPVAGEAALSLRQPVIAPLHDTRQSGDVILAVANGLGGSVGRALPWNSCSDAVVKSLSADILADMKEKGGEWHECGDDLACTLGIYRHQSAPRKFEICSQAITLRMAGFPNTAKTLEAWPCKGLPPWEPPRFSGDPLQFPLHLVIYRPAPFVENGMHALPWLSELPLVSGNPWPVRAEINPADAARFGLADGDEVLVESSVGSCKALAQVSDGVRAGAVAMALGKSGVVDLVVPDEDRLSGVLAWQGTRVRVRKAS